MAVQALSVLWLHNMTCVCCAVPCVSVYCHSAQHTQASQVILCSHNTDNACTAIYVATWTKCVILAKRWLAHWWWFPCKLKHVGAAFLILICFNKLYKCISATKQNPKNYKHTTQTLNWRPYPGQLILFTEHNISNRQITEDTKLLVTSWRQCIFRFLGTWDRYEKSFRPFTPALPMGGFVHLSTNWSKITAFWDVMSCSQVDFLDDRLFQFAYPDDVTSGFLWNVQNIYQTTRCHTAVDSCFVMAIRTSILSDKTLFMLGVFFVYILGQLII